MREASRSKRDEGSSEAHLNTYIVTLYCICSVVYKHTHAHAQIARHDLPKYLGANAASHRDSLRRHPRPRASVVSVLSPPPPKPLPSSPLSLSFRMPDTASSSASSSSSSASRSDHGASAMDYATGASGPADDQPSNDDPPSVHTLARRIRKKIASTKLDTPLSVNDYRKAADAMVRLRTALDSVTVDDASSVVMDLTCAGIALLRRYAIAVDVPAIHCEFVHGVALLFVLIVDASPVQHAPESPTDVADDANGGIGQTAWLTAWHTEALVDVLRRATNSSWDAVVHTPASNCRHCLHVVARRATTIAMPELFQFASCFFRVSHELLTTRLLTQAAPIAPPDPFLTLSTASLLEAANDTDTGDGLCDKQLAMVADQGESELGQMFLRDLVLSFTLPRRVIGTRRAPLLSREQNAVATQHHSDVVANAHDVAMRGAQWCWHNDRNDLNRMCALLAGLCVVMAGPNAASLRTDDAFAGRVMLPFLVTPPPASKGPCLALIEHTHEWIVYSLDASGVPTVQLRHYGFDGLKHAVHVLVQGLNKR